MPLVWFREHTPDAIYAPRHFALNTFERLKSRHPETHATPYHFAFTRSVRARLDFEWLTTNLIIGRMPCGRRLLIMDRTCSDAIE